MGNLCILYNLMHDELLFSVGVSILEVGILWANIITLLNIAGFNRCKNFVCVLLKIFKNWVTELFDVVCEKVMKFPNTFRKTCLNLLPDLQIFIFINAGYRIVKGCRRKRVLEVEIHKIGLSHYNWAQAPFYSNLF